MMRYRTRKRLQKVLVVVIPFLLGLALFYSFLPFTKQVDEPLEEATIPAVREAFTFEDDPLSTEGFTQIEVEALPGGIILKNNCTGVLISMSNLKSFSIKRGFENVLDIRPNYHDLTYDIVDHYGGEVVLAKVSRLKNNFYYADLYILSNGDILHLDSRPSDAIGIASRFAAPVYVEDGLLEKQGVDICQLR